VTPYVHVDESPTGPHAGQVLQPHPGAPVERTSASSEPMP
jgi:hypothetical protein